jgi:hypothetical protein
MRKRQGSQAHVAVSTSGVVRGACGAIVLTFIPYSP